HFGHALLTDLGQDLVGTGTEGRSEELDGVSRLSAYHRADRGDLGRQLLAGVGFGHVLMVIVVAGDLVPLGVCAAKDARACQGGVTVEEERRGDPLLCEQVQQFRGVLVRSVVEGQCDATGGPVMAVRTGVVGTGHPRYGPWS